MKKRKLLTLITCFVFTVVVGLSIGLIVFLPKNTKADTDTGNQVNNNEIETIVESTIATGADTASMKEKGGAIHIEDGAVFNMTGGVVSGHSEKYGGAVYVASGATFNMTGGTISGNQAEYGGAIYVESGGRCIITGGSIIQNSASVSPAIHLEKGAQLEIGNNAIIKDNFVSEYEYKINYYVDGVYVSTQSAVELDDIDFSETAAPLSYEECVGYYLEPELVTDFESVEVSTNNTPDVAFIPNIPQQSTKPLFNNKKTVSFYTKKASKNLLFTLNENAGGYEVSTPLTIVGELVIPREYNNVNVVAIKPAKTLENGAFYNQDKLTSVVFPSTLKTISSYSFAECDSLKEVIISPYIEIVESYAFTNSGLNSIFIHDGLKTLESYAFAETKDLIVAYMPNTIQNVGEKIFFVDAYEYYSCPDVFVNGTQSNWTEGWDVCVQTSEYGYDMYETVDVQYNSSVGDYISFVSYDDGLHENNPDFTFVYGYISKYIGTDPNVVIPENARGLLTKSLGSLVIERVFVPEGITCVNGGLCPGEAHGFGPMYGADYSVVVYFEGEESFEVSTNGLFLETKTNATRFEFDAATLNFEVDGTTLIRYLGQGEDSMLYVPEGITRITEGAFSGLNHEGSLVLPSTCIRVDDNAFKNSTIGVVFVHPSTTNIATYAFNGSYTMVAFYNGTSFVMPEEMYNYYSTRDDTGFVGAWQLYTNEGEFKYVLRSRWGDGSESNPYLINSVNGIKEMITFGEQTLATETQEVYPTITKTLSAGTTTGFTTNTKHFKLVSDIDFEDAQLEVADTNTSSIYLDGAKDNGYNYAFRNFGKSSFKSGWSLLGTLYCSTIKNIDVWFGSGVYPLVDTVSGINETHETLFENIKIYKEDSLSELIIDAEDSSCSPFVYFSRGGTLRMKSCINNEDIINLAPYAAVFIGGSCTGHIVFEDCWNFGDFFCANNGGIFIGNNYYKPASLTLDHCVNTGDLSYKTTGNPQATILAAYTSGRNWKLSELTPYNETVEGELYNNYCSVIKRDSQLDVSVNGDTLILNKADGFMAGVDYHFEISIAGRMYTDLNNTAVSKLIYVKHEYVRTYDDMMTSDNFTEIWHQFYDYDTYKKEYGSLPNSSFNSSNDMGDYYLYVDHTNNIYVVKWKTGVDVWKRHDTYTDWRYYIIVLRDGDGNILDYLSVQVK